MKHRQGNNDFKPKTEENIMSQFGISDCIRFGERKEDWYG